MKSILALGEPLDHVIVIKRFFLLTNQKREH